MFDQVLQNMQKAAESSVRVQQEMFQKWMETFATGGSAMPTMPAGLDAAAQWRRKWEEACTDMVKRQKQLAEQNFDAGIKGLEEIFSVADIKSQPELQQKVTELYRKSFDSMRQLSESHMKQFKEVAEKWAGVMTGG